MNASENDTRAVLSPEQARAARAMLTWGQGELEERSGVPRRSIISFEADERRPRRATIEGLRRAFEEAGVRFFGDTGVYLRTDSRFADTLPRLRNTLLGVMRAAGTLQERVGAHVSTILPLLDRDFPEDLREQWAGVRETFRACSPYPAGKAAPPAEAEIAAAIEELLGLIEALACLK